MFERFTAGARHAVVHAQTEARHLADPIVGTEHLLLGLLEDRDGPAARALAQLGVSQADIRSSTVDRAAVNADSPEPALDADALASIGIDLDAVRERVEKSFGPGALDRRSSLSRRFGGHRPFSPRAKKVLELSLREAIQRKSATIGTEHLLFGILREGAGLGAVLLAQAGVDRPAVETAITAIQRDDGSAQDGRAG